MVALVFILVSSLTLNPLWTRKARTRQQKEGLSRQTRKWEAGGYAFQQVHSH